MSAMTCGPLFAQAQQESAELYLEEYTDEFQENFFEGLKQKAIGNHDRAISHFLKCKQLEPGNSVVDYELAKAHYLAKQYVQAQQHALSALSALPGDYWVLDQLVSIMDAQGIPLSALGKQIPMDNDSLQGNLAQIYFKDGQYQKSLALLQDLEDAALKAQLARKITDSLRDGDRGSETLANTAPREPDGSMGSLRSALEGMIGSGDPKALLELSGEALETYPMQPFFYYAHGAALIDSGDPAKALEVLSSGLDFVLDDVPLRNNIYREMARAHTLLGNPVKANEYSSKINSGL